MSDDSGSSARAEALRREFDLAFARPAQATPTTVDMMLIRIGAQVLAIRLSEVAAIRADAKTMPCPSRHAAFRGIAGIRGAMVPVWDLALLLGHDSQANARWLFMPNGAPLALRFDAFERHRRVDAATLRSVAGGDPRGHMREMLEDAGEVFPVIDIASIVATIRAAVKNVSG